MAVTEKTKTRPLTVLPQNDIGQHDTAYSDTHNNYSKVVAAIHLDMAEQQRSAVLFRADFI